MNGGKTMYAKNINQGTDIYLKAEYRARTPSTTIGAKESVLETLTNSYTKLPNVTSKGYNIDKCSCGTCGCLKVSLIAVLSPAGIAGSAALFGPASAMD